MRDKQFYEVYEQIKYTTGCYDDNARSCAEILLDDLGYRKPEWISVEDRLPELETTRSDGHHRPRSVRALCVCKQRSGKVFVKEGYYELFSNTPCWRIPGSIDSVTHWMPLPAPPTEKENGYE